METVSDWGDVDFLADSFDLVDARRQIFNLGLEKEFLPSNLIHPQRFTDTDKKLFAFEEGLNHQRNGIDIETVQELGFVLVFLLIGLLFYNPAIYLDGLLFGFHPGVVADTLSAAKYQVVARVWSVLNAVVGCAQTNLFGLVKIYRRDLFGFFDFVNGELRLPFLF